MYISSLSGIKSLKSFGNLPTQHNLTLHSHYLRDIQNCTQYTVGRLVKNKCRHLLPKLIQNCSPASTFRWQEAHKQKPIGGKASCAQSGNQSAGARNRAHLNARCSGFANQHIARIGNKRCTGIRNQRNISPIQQLPQYILDPIALVMVMERNHWLADTEMFQEPPTVPRILCSNNSHA